MPENVNPGIRLAPSLFRQKDWGREARNVSSFSDRLTTDDEILSLDPFGHFWGF